MKKQLKKRIEDWGYVRSVCQKAIEKQDWEAIDQLQRLASMEMGRSKSLEERKGWGYKDE